MLRLTHQGFEAANATQAVFTGSIIALPIDGDTLIDPDHVDGLRDAMDEIWTSRGIQDPRFCEAVAEAVLEESDTTRSRIIERVSVGSPDHPLPEEVDRTIAEMVRVELLEEYRAA